MKKAIVSILLISGLAGCSSLQLRVEDRFEHPYAGFKVSFPNAGCNLMFTGVILFAPAPLILADIPLSLLLDTLTLPLDIYASINKTEKQLEPRPEDHKSPYEYCF